MINAGDVEYPSKYMKTKAFERPSDGDTIHWHTDTAPPLYLGYLVEIVSKVGGMVTFRGVPRDAPTVTDLPLHVVDVNDWNQAWGALPSTIEGWNPATGNTCALLFLRESYVADKPDLLPAGGCGKYPCAVGDVRIKERKRLEALKAKVNDLMRRLDGENKRIAEEIVAAIE
jgi:hypothetical protein